MDTIELIVSVPALDQDWLVGRLADRATGFVQDSTTVRAYVPATRWSRAAHEALRARLRAAGYTSDALTVQVLSNRNWNAVWEDAIDPVRAGPFVVCPTDAEHLPEQGDAVPLWIDPRQSFGTGHHATTRLALRLLANAVSPGDRVLDVGTGTGILAIAACVHGARQAVGVDVNPQAVTNARDNVAANDTAACVTIRQGSVEAAPEGRFEVVAANITRHTLIDLLPALPHRLREDGRLLLSGILESDRAQMVAALDDRGLECQDEIVEDGWWAAYCRT